MVSASVRTMSFLNNQAVSTRKDVSSDNKTDDFAKMMDKTINKAKDAGAKTEVKAENKTEEKSEISETEFDKKYKEVVENEEVSPEEKVVCDETIAEEDIVEELPEEVSNEILSLLADILNVTVDEIKASLENLNIESKDLLETENVTKLVMDLKGLDNKMELLVHNDANDAIKEIGKAIEQLLEKVNNEELTVLEDDVQLTDKLVATDEVVQKNDEVVEEPEQEGVPTETVVKTNNEVENKETGFEGNNNSQEKSTDDNKAEVTNNNTLEELKGNIINEIQVELEERVDETISTRIVREIAENISVAVREKMTSLEMQLNPEHLGKVTVILASEESGITAKITAETEMAKNAIEQQLTLLKENLDKQGLKVTDIEVTIASHGFEQNLDKEDKNNEGQQKKNSGIRRSLLDELNGVNVEEEKQEDIMMQALGNTVSYLA